MRQALIALCLLFTLSLSAQTDTAWKREVAFQLNFSQVSLTNWQGGGQDAIAGAGFIKALAEYAEGKDIWQNKLDIGYGLLRAGSDAALQKTDDDLHFLSKYSRVLRKPWNGVALLDFQTLMTPGYKYSTDSAGNLIRDEKLSSFLSPGYLITSLGAEYRPSDDFFVMLAPVSGKFTFVTDDSLAAQGAYGVDTGKNFRAEFGANAKTLLRLKLMDNILFENEAGLFANYKTIDEIDVDWKAALIMSVNKFINAKVSTHLIYDKDIIIEKENGTTGPGVQFKEVFSLGIQYLLQ